MSSNEASSASEKHSPDTRTTKRNSGLFSFFKWFKNPGSTSRESVDSDSSSTSSSLTSSDSVDSVDSTYSTGTVASFSYVPPDAYNKNYTPTGKSIALGPETDTYKARLQQREKIRESDRNITLRKKYNLFFNKDTLLKQPDTEEDNSKSLPLMTKRLPGEVPSLHRRTASESSKIKKAGAYCHVKGKRKAPQPPHNDTLSLRRRKRTAPAPPPTKRDDVSDIISNDSLKLDHGILKPAKEDVLQIETNSARSSYIEAPVSPRPWYKRNVAAATVKKDKHERLPELQYARNSATDLNLDETKIEAKKKGEEKRKSGIAFLTNISELDREAAELLKKDKAAVSEMPAFMRPKPEQINTDSLASPKRKSAKDLIAKFNAITSVTKVTVNAFQRDKREYFGGKSPKKTAAKKTNNEPNPLMKSESATVLKSNEMKEKTPKPDRKCWYCPKCRLENDYWRIICQVCSTIKPYFDDLSLEKNQIEDKIAPVKVPPPDIKPLKTLEPFERNLERSRTQIGFAALTRYTEQKEKKVEKTANLDDKSKESPDGKKEEREKLIKMLIEMKNSLPKRRAGAGKENKRTSIIEEGLEALDNESNKKDLGAISKGKSGAIAKDNQVKINSNRKELKKYPMTAKITSKSDKEAVKETISSFVAKIDNISAKMNKEAINIITVNDKEDEHLPTPHDKSHELLLVTQKTIYENIKVKPLKVSSSAQTSAIVKKTPSITGAIKKDGSFELIKPKDFADIYNEKMGKSDEDQHLYANWDKPNGAESMSLFVNIPKKLSDLRNFDIAGNTSSNNNNNTDTLEINRLLRRLETAIGKGELTDAAVFARELAQLKVNCSVIRQREDKGLEKKGTEITVNMFVEDRLSHRGPFPIQVSGEATVGELKKQVEKDFEIPANVQRWILGKELAIDDKSTLKSHHVTTNGCPVFLYLVAPTRDQKPAEKPKEQQNPIKTPSNSNDHPQTTTTETIEIKIEPADKEKKNKDLSPPQPSTSHHQAKLTEVDNPVRETVTVLEKKLDEAPKAPYRKSSSFEEDFADYDCKTLKPKSLDWECKTCTLLNPPASNICAVCATVRQQEQPTPPKAAKRKAPQPAKRKNETKALHLQLLDLDNGDLVANTEAFECMVCLMEIGTGDGVTLRECLHQFCKQCLAYTVEYTDEAEIKCPYRDDQYSCDIALQDREVKALVEPNIYEQYLARSVAQVENKIEKSFHCKTPDCKGWCIFEDNVNEFKCPVCLKMNCLTCQAIHTGMNCKQYQEKMNAESDIDENAKRTREMLEEMVNKGEALTCPVCQVILMKKWGCDWVRCSMCKTEICWVTRGPRWGPAGKGDTSGGCKCGVNGVKCHAQCNYCH